MLNQDQEDLLGEIIATNPLIGKTIHMAEIYLIAALDMINKESSKDKMTFYELKLKVGIDGRTDFSHTH